MKKVILHVSKRDSGLCFICPPTHHFNHWAQESPAREHGVCVAGEPAEVVKQMIANDTIPSWEELDGVRFQPMVQSVVDFLIMENANDRHATEEAAIEFLRIQRSGEEESERVAAWKKHLSWLT